MTHDLSQSSRAGEVNRCNSSIVGNNVVLPSIQVVVGG